jgi:hypothetical protein
LRIGNRQRYEPELIPAVEIDVNRRLSASGTDEQAATLIQHVVLVSKSPRPSGGYPADALKRKDHPPRIAAPSEQKGIPFRHENFKEATIDLDVNHSAPKSDWTRAIISALACFLHLQLLPLTSGACYSLAWFLNLKTLCGRIVKDLSNPVEKACVASPGGLVPEFVSIWRKLELQAEGPRTGP